MKNTAFVSLGMVCLLWLLSSCTSMPAAPPASPTAPQPTQPPPPTATQKPAGEATLLYQQLEQVVYSYAYDPQDLEAAHLCLWQQGKGLIQLDETSQEVRWFTNAVISRELGLVVYTRYLRQSDLVEIWSVGLEGGNPQRLVDSDTFMRLGEGFARAIPQQMLALPGGLLVFNTSEFGYKTDLLNDLHLLDLNNGQLTTLLPAGQGGPLSRAMDGVSILVDSPQGWFMFDTTTQQLYRVLPQIIEPVSTLEPTATLTLPELQDCAP